MNYHISYAATSLFFKIYHKGGSDNIVWLHEARQDFDGAWTDLQTYRALERAPTYQRPVC